MSCNWVTSGNGLGTAFSVMLFFAPTSSIITLYRDITAAIILNSMQVKFWFGLQPA